MSTDFRKHSRIIPAAILKTFLALATIIPWKMPPTTGLPPGPCPPPGQYGCFVCAGHTICVDPPPSKPAKR